MTTDRWLEQWSNSAYNAEISASGSAQFATGTTDKENRSKYGSMNFLIISNRSDYDVKVVLDGEVYTELGSNATLVIEASDGRYFDLIEVTNLDGSNAIATSLIHLRWGRSEFVSRE